MNRKQKRDLRKDKNLVKELYSIIIKYFPKLLDMFNDLTDKRHQSYITYDMKTICVTRLFGLLCGLTSMTDITNKFDSEIVIKNLSQICKQNLEELPYWETIQDVFINMDISELRNIIKYIVKALLRSKMFDKYKFDGYFQLVIDGTRLSSHNYNLNNNCIVKTYKDGKKCYCKYVLECKLVVGNIVISLDTEFIENSSSLNQKEKQDCEINAFKRMAVRIKKNYPKYKFIITGDALYAAKPIIDICINNNWKYIFNLNDKLRVVFKDFNDYIEVFNNCNIKNYFLDKNYKYKSVRFDMIKYHDTKNSKSFHYITNFNVTDNNIKNIVMLGRKRWKIENEGFYTQKHRTFDITHLNSRNDNAIKCHYLFIQIAHTIRQLLEQGNALTKLLNLKIKEVSDHLLNKLTSIKTNLNDIETNFQLRFDT